MTDILKKAHEITEQRRAVYGDIDVFSNRCAAALTAIFGWSVKPEHVNLMMIVFKVCRETHMHTEDNLVDIAGYAHIQQQLIEILEQDPFYVP